MDLERLERVYGAQVLVSLLEDQEYDDLRIPRLLAEAESRGFEVLRLPIPDAGVPADLAAVASVVQAITEHARSGWNVVIHCKGSLGRAGTIGACVLVAGGRSPSDALGEVRRARGPNAPETGEQAEFVRRFERPWLLRSRVLGCVLGAAIGDALGHPTEFLSAEEIRRQYPPNGVTGYALYWERDDARFAPYTDDTQMAEIVLRSLLHASAQGLGLDATMDQIARGFVGWLDSPQGGHRAPGHACLAGSRALARGLHWSVAGGETAGGCGSVMRAYPFGVLFANDLDHAEQWAVEHSKLTHRDPIALAACAAMARGTALAIQGEPIEAVLSGLVEAARPYSDRTADMIDVAVAEGREGVPPEVTLGRLEGWAAHEAIAAAAYVACRHPDDPRSGLLEGANSPGDSDSVATLAGPLLGAANGIEALPTDWVADLERTEELSGLAQAAAGRVLVSL